MKPITVLLSDDHTIVRQGLRALLDATEDILVIGEAENGRQAVVETQRLRPDVILLDCAMPLLNGVQATRQIVQALPTARVLILSSYNDAQHVRHAIEAGAAGYLMKETAASELLEGIREISIGNAFFSPLLLKSLFQRHSVTTGARLSTRQMEVLQLIAEGYMTKQISALLAITDKTVEKHRQSLMDRLDIHGIADLTRYAYSSGMVEINPIMETPEIPITAQMEDVALPEIAMALY
jgi:DNA-binding NarL/FixJ family response regulator